MCKHLSRGSGDIVGGGERCIERQCDLLVTLLHNSIEMCRRVTLQAYLLPAASGTEGGGGR